MKALVLRLDSPMLSFGSVMVDQHGFVDRFPGLAMLVGLIGNALGWRHQDFELLQQLQDRLDFAARWDVAPERLVDYQTVDLGQAKMLNACWTTRGEPEHRTTGDPRATHQRYRHYWADGMMSVVITLTGEVRPTANDVADALKKPARPLFIGRKACLPARPLLDPLTPIVEGDTLAEILDIVPVWSRNGSPVREPRECETSWPEDAVVSSTADLRRVYDLRDWQNQVPSGSRWRQYGLSGGD